MLNVLGFQSDNFNVRLSGSDLARARKGTELPSPKLASSHHKFCGVQVKTQRCRGLAQRSPYKNLRNRSENPPPQPRGTSSLHTALDTTPTISGEAVLSSSGKYNGKIPDLLYLKTHFLGYISKKRCALHAWLALVANLPCARTRQGDTKRHQREELKLGNNGSGSSPSGLWCCST